MYRTALMFKYVLNKICFTESNGIHPIDPFCVLFLLSSQQILVTRVPYLFQIEMGLQVNSKHGEREIESVWIYIDPLFFATTSRPVDDQEF